MLFVVEYELVWDSLEPAIAKRLEWMEVKPESFTFVGEYVWTDRDPPFRGVAIIETDSVEDIHAFLLHYGPTLKAKVHPATDVMSGIRQVGADGLGDADGGG